MTNRHLTIALGCFTFLLLSGWLFWHAGAETRSPSDPAYSIPSALTYSDPVYGFSFEYRSDLAVDAFDDDTGYAVLVSKPGSREEFQIYITPYADSAPITADTVREALPAFAISHVAYPHFDGLPDAPLAFSSTDENLGELYEVWFTHEGLLYQTSTYADARDLLEHTLNTWRHGTPPSYE